MELKWSNDSGFTIIELVTTMSIILILSSIGVLAFKDMYNGYKLKGAARQLFSDMQYARLNSIKGGKEWILDFSSDGTYVVQPKTLGADDRVKRGDIPGAFFPVKICTFNGDALEDNDAEFNPNGTAKAEVRYKVSLDDSVYKIYISSAGTGNVRTVKVTDPPCGG